MPTQIYRLTAAPVNLIGATGVDGVAISLEVAKTYQARFVAVGPQAICKVLEAPDAAVVDASDSALPIRVFEDLTIVPVAGQSIFVWSEDGGQLVINDVP